MYTLVYIILYFRDTIVYYLHFIHSHFFKTHKGKNNTFRYLLEISLNNLTCTCYVTKKRDGNKSNCRGLTEMTVKRQAREIWNESNPSVLHNARPPYSPIRVLTAFLLESILHVAFICPLIKQLTSR